MPKSRHGAHLVGLSRTGAATGDMGDPHENLDQAGTGLAGADDTEGAGTTPPA